MTIHRGYRWLIRALVRLLPHEIKADYGESIIEDYALKYEETRAAEGRLAAHRFVLLSIADLLSLCLRERVRRRSTGSGRSGRRLVGGNVSWLDLKLAFRMLVKYPGLTLVGGFGLAVAVAIGAASYEIISGLLEPALPVEEGKRVVALINATSNPGNPDRRVLHDFVTWREELESVGQLGAYRTVGRNLVLDDGRAEPVQVAEITASGFLVARTPPLHGRHLVPDDEREGAPWVAVIGHDVWQSRFAGDRDIIGQTIRIGATPHAVVGVMPEGFAFPVDHQFWLPLRVDPLDYERGQGPWLNVFGRLTPGVTLDEAQAELTTIGRRTAAAYPDIYEQLRPRVVRYTHEQVGVDVPMVAWALRIGQLLISMLLVVVCVNIAILVYARTVARSGEIAVRSALGASRRRIVAQLFIEAFVLSTLAAAIGLLPARVALGRIQLWMPSVGEVPFWFDLGLSVETVLYVLGLAVLAAVIVGVLPGLRATGRRAQSSLRELTGGTGIRLGRTWTFLIVAQVAIAVGILPPAMFAVWQVARHAVSGPGFPADEFLTAHVVSDDETASSGSGEGGQKALASRFGARQTELARRLEAEPGVTAVAFSSPLVPGRGRTARIELDGGAPAQEAESGRRVRFLRVGVGLFDAYDAVILAGRAFDAGDLAEEATPVIVNRTFERRHFGNQSALGRRIRYVSTRWAEPEPWAQGNWYEIVGIVSDFPAYASGSDGSGEARVYHPLAPGAVRAGALSLRLEGAAPTSLTQRVREIAAQIDPTMQLLDVRSLAEVYRQSRFTDRLQAWAFALMTLSVMLLSAAGIYALLSFTVAQRTREIGIRAALGAHPRRILSTIFARLLRQLALGVAVGSLLAGGLFAGIGVPAGRATFLLLVAGAIMLAVGVVAALGPARRGLRIQPTDALRADA